MHETATVRAVIIDPLPLFCDAIRACLAKSGHGVVGEAPNLEDALQKLDSLHPNLVVVEPHLLKPSLIVCREIIRHSPNIKTMVFASHAEEPLFQVDAAYIGVSACVPPEITDEECLAVIGKVMAGQQLFSHEILTQAFQPIELTPREREVLKFMVAEKTDREIADTLGIKLSTVRNHTQRILEKLNVHHRQEAIWRARHRGIV